MSFFWHKYWNKNRWGFHDVKQGTDNRKTCFFLFSLKSLLLQIPSIILKTYWQQSHLSLDYQFTRNQLSVTTDPILVQYNWSKELCSFGISIKDEELDLPSIYWILKLHKCPFKQRYIAGSAKCSTKPLSKLLTCILSVVKTGLQSYCDTSYSRGGVNQMWILKNSKDLLEYIQSRSLSSCNSIKTFDFSTLYTTIPHSKLKDRLRELVQLYFIKKKWPT